MHKITLVSPPSRLAPAPQIQPMPPGFRSRGAGGGSPLHRKAKIPFPAGFLRRRFSPCRPGSAPGDARGGAPCIRKPKSPSPPGSCAAGSAHAARVQPRGCKGRSPLHEITLVSPFPAGEGGWGDGARNKAKGRVRRHPQPPSPPWAPQRQGQSGDRKNQPPAGRVANSPAPCRPGSAPGDARGGAPCMK